VKLGLIGAGRWGRRFIETIKTLPGFELSVVASSNPETPALTGPGTRVVSDWREALSGVDGVIVATPPSAHAAAVTAAIERGLPAMVEKPLTTDFTQAKALLALAEHKKAIVLVDHIHLFSAAFDRFQEKASKLGELKSLRTEGGNWGPFREDVGPLWDYGPHDVAFCLAAAKRKPRSVVYKREEQRDGGETIRLALGFSEGLAADIKVSNILKERTRIFEAVYEKGTARLEHRPDDEAPLARALKAFAAAVKKKDHSLSSLKLGVDVVEVLSLAKLS
jgi:predicted dehydrogenase